MLGLFKSKKAFKQALPSNTTATNTRAPTTTISQDQEYERQRKIIAMQKTLEDMKVRIEEVYKKIDQKQTAVKDLIRNKRKTEAKRQLQTLKALQDEVAKQENMCIILEKTKIQLETANDTSKVVQVFKDAAELQKDVERNRDYLDDFLMEKKEREETNAEIGRILGEIAAGDQEEKDEIDRMYAEMESETLDEDIQKVNKEPLRNLPRASEIKSRVKEDKREVEESSIDKLLMESAGIH